MYHRLQNNSQVQCESIVELPFVNDIYWNRFSISGFRISAPAANILHVKLETALFLLP